MLDQNDLKILTGMFAASEERMMKRMDRLEGRMDALEDQQKKMETNLYEEIGRVQTYLEKKIDAVREEVEAVKTYYRIDRMENATSATILQIVSTLQKDVEELKKKIA